MCLDLNELRRLVSDGLTARQISQEMGCTVFSVYSKCRAHGLVLSRDKRGPRPLAERLLPPASEADTDAGEEATDPEKIALRATGGRYRDIAEYAASREITLTQAMQRWHCLGLEPRARRA